MTFNVLLFNTGNNLGYQITYSILIILTRLTFQQWANPTRDLDLNSDLTTFAKSCGGDMCSARDGF